MTVSKRNCLLFLVGTAVVFLNGCLPLVLYGPRTYYDAQTSAVVAPFKSVWVEFNTNASAAPVSISLGDPDSSKLKHLSFVSATMVNEDGNETSLRLNSEILENPNSFRMDFGKADYLGHNLHFRVNVVSEGKNIEITFKAQFKSKVVWPKDSDYSG